MRIAFVSREYAGVGSGGGIGTYVRNAARMLATRGHDVEVFTEGQPAGMRAESGIRINIANCRATDFAEAIVPPFEAAHQANPFDVVESAEYGADAAIVFERFPEVARIVKLHTANFQIGAMNEAYLTLGMKARFVAGALRRGRMPKPFWNKYEPECDRELALTLLADEITSPSKAMLDWTSDAWPISAMARAVIPNVFVPPAELLACVPAGRPKLVTFVGKLEVRKGVLELAAAIPQILKAHPDARFRFVGRALLHPATRRPLDETIRHLAGSAASKSIEFTGALDYADVASHLAESAIAVFPSYWENHPYVCLEAMAAGCAVVGSNAGGMAEMIEHGRTGMLVAPEDPAAIAQAVIELLRDDERRASMGAAARAHVLSAYSTEAIAPLQEASYKRAIAKRQRLAEAVR
ncbi:glycosyltransferase family 4 protein [Novosphingobium sp.]|uniref:glycosyltransferase family 4 protein n=1 Tax=Novosphingobium sp. TaxID=1874826 RepID=UPI0025DEA31E|nr:glycosyltransferase family 4 protein [Novosphingobium sp.]